MHSHRKAQAHLLGCELTFSFPLNSSHALAIGFNEPRTEEVCLLHFSSLAASPPLHFPHSCASILTGATNTFPLRVWRLRSRDGVRRTLNNLSQSFPPAPGPPSTAGLPTPVFRPVPSVVPPLRVLLEAAASDATDAADATRGPGLCGIHQGGLGKEQVAGIPTPPRGRHGRQAITSQPIYSLRTPCLPCGFSSR